MRFLRAAFRVCVFALAALLVGPTFQGAEALAQSVGSFPLDIRPLVDHVHTAGDSLMAGSSNTPPPGTGYISPVANTINATMALRAAAARPTVCVSTVGATQVVSTLGGQIAWTQDAISGTTIQQLADSVTTRVMAYAPAGDGSNWILIIDVSPNDWSAADQGRPEIWTTPATTILTTVRATKPNTRIVLLSSIFGLGEKWTAAPAAAWGLNSADADVAGLNAIAAAWAAANGVRFVDIRGNKTTDAHTMAEAESVLNPGNVTSGIITSDGEHPIIDSGQKIFSARLLAGWLNVLYPF